MKHQHSRLLPIYISLSVIVGIFLGSYYARHFSGGRVSLINTSSNKLSDLLHIIDDQYVDTVSINDLVEKALPQILRELDPHSTYIGADEVEATMQDLKGSFSGIGVQFTIYDDTVRIVKVIPGGPSERVGLRPGDRIIGVDGKDFVGKDINNEETMKRLKGPSGSEVALVVKRVGEKQDMKFKITRGDVPVKSIDAYYMLDRETGYMRINTWGDGTYSEFLSAMAKLNSEGADGLVIDLRGNLGGYLNAAVQVANEFLPKGRLIVYTEGRRFPREDYESDGRGSYQRTPLVILVDETSASASEIFAGCMQDNDRAIICGRRTFGKGLVQVPIEFRDGSMVRLTRARYYTPSGRCVQKPYVPGDEEAYENDLIQRADAGEYFSQDSIKTSGEKYHTRLGRVVYGGGGIIPDHFISRDTLGYTSYFKEILINGQMAVFAYRFVDQHRALLSKMKTCDEVAQYLKKQNIVEQFVGYAEKNGTKRRNLMIRTSHNIIERFLTSYIINDVLDTKEVVSYSNRSDEAVIKALQIIKQGKSFPQNDEKRTEKKGAGAKKAACAGGNGKSRPMFG